MNDPEIGDTGEGSGFEGLEGYPYASPEAERTIKRVTTAMSFAAVALLLVGLYFALFTTQVAIGGVLSLVGFIELIFVPFFAKRLRAQAIEREQGQGLR